MSQKLPFTEHSTDFPNCPHCGAVDFAVYSTELCSGENRDGWSRASWLMRVVRCHVCDAKLVHTAGPGGAKSWRELSPVEWIEYGGITQPPCPSCDSYDLHILPPADGEDAPMNATLYATCLECQTHLARVPTYERDWSTVDPEEWRLLLDAMPADVDDDAP